MSGWTLDPQHVLSMGLHEELDFAEASVQALEYLTGALPVERGFLLRQSVGSPDVTVVAGRTPDGDLSESDRVQCPRPDVDFPADTASVHHSRLRMYLHAPLTDGEALVYSLELPSGSAPSPDGMPEAELELLEQTFRVFARHLRGLYQIEQQASRIRELDQQLATVRSDLDPATEAERPSPPSDVAYYHGIITRSPRMLEIIDTIERIRGNDLNVVVTGETGTGKELIARAIHASSERSGGPFETVGCGTLTRSLLESELFGHRKGAFSGAENDHAGIFERAAGGTVFFDEVADMTTEMQQKVLRVLQEGEVRPVGASDVVKVDVRIVSSSRHELTDLVKAGTFRDDLFYRLNVFSVELPPLRERPEDVQILIDHFLDHLCEENGERKGLAEGALGELRNYAWPGNVQELHNVLTRAFLSTTGRSMTRKVIRPLLANEVLGTRGNDDLFQEGTRLHLRIPLRQGFNEIIAECEQLVLINALRANRGNKSRVTKQLGIPRQTLYNKIEKYRISDEDYLPS